MIHGRSHLPTPSPIFLNVLPPLNFYQKKVMDFHRLVGTRINKMFSTYVNSYCSVQPQSLIKNARLCAVILEASVTEKITFYFKLYFFI